MNKKQLKMVSEHAKKMFNMRFMGLDWQEIHQKRWDDTVGCNEKFLLTFMVDHPIYQMFQ